jgi:LL-diaminopimelate aminotransferase
MGSQDGLSHLATAMVDPGEYVLVPDPGYPIYEASVTIAGGKVYPMPLLEENGFIPMLEDIPTEVLEKTKMMILSYPGNPVTAIADRSFFEKVVDFAKKHQILVVHDFAYSELIFDDVGNPGAIQILASFKSHIDYGVFLPIQKAAVAALRSDFTMLDEQKIVYEERRDTLIEGLNKSGWKVKKTSATMFIWTKIPEGWTSREFAFELLDHAGVAVVPGDAFGAEGEGYVRIALVQPSHRLAEAAERIDLFLQQYRKVTL